MILDTISKPPLQSSPEKLTAEPPSVTSPSRLNLARTTGRVAASFGQQFDAVVALALMIATTNPKYLLSSPPVISGLSFLDHSWAFDLVVKAGQHIWMGDRVVFTYGPVFQLASSIVTNSLGGTLGAYFRSWYLLPFWSGIVLTFLTGRILLGGHSVWKRSFYLLALVGFWTALDLRFCFDFFMLAMALRYFDRVCQSGKIHPWSAFGTVALVLTGFLISADTGLYSLAAFIISGAVHIFLYRAERGVLLVLLRSIVVAAAFLALLASLATLVLSTTFWLDSAAVISQYRWSMFGSMEKPIKWRLVGASAFSLLVLLIGSRLSNLRAASLSRRPAFFAAAICFSLLTLQSTLVRPDWGHVTVALLPTIAMAAAVLMGSEVKRDWNWSGDLPIVLAILITIAFSGPSPVVAPRNVAAGWQLAAITKSQSCPTGTFYLDDACLTQSDYTPLHAVSEYLRSYTSESDTVAIFPFENIYADVARRRVAGGILQNYIAVGDRLVRRQLYGLERDKPHVAIFSADGLATFGVDGVPNFTRTPEIWFFLQSRFRKQRELAPGIVALVSDDARPGHWRQITATAGSSFQSAIRLKRAISVPLDQWQAENDFLKVRLLVRYPIWWKLTKPSSLLVKVRHSDNTEKVLRAILPPNKQAELWIYPWDDGQLVNYFDSDEATWRKGRPRAPVTALQFTFERVDSLSVVPSTINIQSIEAVQLRLY